MRTQKSFYQGVSRRGAIGIFFLVFAGLVASSFGSVQSVKAQQLVRPKDSVNVTSLIAALKHHEAERRELEQTTVQNVRVVNVEDVRESLDRAQVERLDQVLRVTRTDILPVYLKDNKPIMEALEGEPSSSVSVWDTVAIDVLEGGYVIVYYYQR